MSYPINPFRVGDTVKRAEWYAAILECDRDNPVGVVVAVGRMADANCATVDVKWQNRSRVTTHRVNFIDRA